MKNIFLLSLLFLQLQASWAQQPRSNLQWGEELKSPARSSINEVIGISPTGFYALRIQDMYREKPYLELYDRNFALIHSTEIDLKDSIRKEFRNFEKMIYTGEGLFLFSSIIDHKNKDLHLYCRSFDKLRGTPMADDHEIAIFSLTRHSSADISFKISKDSSKVLVFCEIQDDAAEKKQYEAFVFDAQMQQVLWHKQVSAPYPDELCTLEGIELDNLGNVYVLIRRYYDRRQERRRGKPNYDFQLFSYKDLGQTEKQYGIRFQESFINDVAFRVAPNGDILCAGFYSEKATRLHIRGVFAFRIDAQSQEIYKHGFRAFDESFLAQFMSPRNAKRGKELSEYDLREVVLRSDGGLLIVAEQAYIRLVQSPSNLAGGTRIADHTQYAYNDIIAISTAPDGSIEWGCRIPKRQITLDDHGYFSSFSMAIVRDKVHFLYNDHIRNLRLPLTAHHLRTFNGRRSVVVLATIDANGTLTRTPLASNKEQRVLTRPKVAKQLTPHIIMLYAEQNRRYKFGRLWL